MPELTILGHAAAAPASPAEAILERVPNPEPGLTYLVRFACPE
ncbi:MAG: NADPH-dependent 7-cyano-7-deazaguanine reductase QueF, partial [Geminicoccaceae bacterium]